MCDEERCWARRSTCSSIWIQPNAFICNYNTLEKGVGEGKIKKAYHKTSLKVHPDRAKPEDREEATKKFQALGGVYKILSDKDARALYDESGEVNDEGDAANMDDRNWDEHWRVLFNKVTLDDIKNFEEKYKNSREDLICTQ